MSRFHPQDPDSWQEHALYLRDRRPPAPGAPTEEYIAWNLQAGPVVTDDTRRVQHAIEGAQARNRHAPLTGRSIVVVDGPPVAGKTYAVLTAALQQTAVAVSGPPPHPQCHRQRPWVYVEALNHNGAKSIAQALAQGVGALVPRSASTAQHVAAIRHMAPKVGLLGYVIDDAHGLLGARSSTSSSLATAVKGLITGIPATAVIVGANLRRDGIFQGTTGEQVRLSAQDWVVCGDWPTPTGRATTGWERLVRELRSHLAFPTPDHFRLGTRQCVQLLAEGSMGRPGLAIQWVREASVHAVTRGTPMDRAALQATAHVIDPATRTTRTTRRSAT